MLAVIGKKIGMTQLFDESGVLTPVTVIKVDENIVLGKRSREKNGYTAVVLGAVTAKKKRVTKPVLGQYPKGIEPQKIIREFRDYERECTVGEKISVDIFKDTKFVDVIGMSKGKGYQGVVRRHGFKGGPRSHGSKMHREMGSTGQNTFPAHTFKGKKMPGHMGNTRFTVQNLRLLKIDAENKMLIVKGCVPGAINNTLIVTTAKKK
jgi:large subunit ribosomal protein L3